MRDVVAALPHLNPGTVRTHIASRCCVNCAAHHHTRWAYFRAVGNGVYALEVRRFRRSSKSQPRGWQDKVIAAIESGIDPTLIASSLRLTPTERLERMRQAAIALEEMRANARHR